MNYHLRVQSPTCYRYTIRRYSLEEDTQELIREPAEGNNRSENEEALNITADLLKSFQIFMNSLQLFSIIGIATDITDSWGTVRNFIDRFSNRLTIFHSQSIIFHTNLTLSTRE